MDQLQIYVRDSKDKTAELTKKFKMVVDKLTANDADPEKVGAALHVVEHKFPEFSNGKPHTHGPPAAHSHGHQESESPSPTKTDDHHHEKEKSPGLKKNFN